MTIYYVPTMCHPQIYWEVQIRYLRKVEFPFKMNSSKFLCMTEESTRNVAEHMVTNLMSQPLGQKKMTEKGNQETIIRSCQSKYIPFIYVMDYVY